MSQLLFWVLSLGLPIVVIAAFFLLAPVLFWQVWAWLIGTKPGRTVLAVAVIGFTLLISHHVVWQQGYDARVAEEKSAVEKANAAVRKQDDANTKTSEAVAAAIHQQAEVERAAAAETTAAAIANIRRAGRTAAARHCDPLTPQQAAAEQTIDDEGRAAVERARGKK